MIADIRREQPNRGRLTDTGRVLIFDDDPVLQGLVATVCDKHGWSLTVAQNQFDTLLPAGRLRPKLLLLGFSLSDENSLQLLYDLHAVSPQAPLAIITGEEPGDVADVVGLAGGTAVVVGPCAVTDSSALR